jgi:hypothetical protein
MMENLKRWWWVVAIVVVAGGALMYSVLGKGGPAPVANNGQPGGPSTPGTSGASVGTQSAAPGSPGSSTATNTPGGPTVSVPMATEGAKLATVTAIPKNTLARIKFSESRNNQKYDITFSVYGTGPPVGGHGALVVLIGSSTPQNASEDSFNFQGMNALLQIGPKVTVTKGGEYTGVMQLMSQSGGLVPVLVEAKAK